MTEPFQAAILHLGKWEARELVHWAVWSLPPPPVHMEVVNTALQLLSVELILVMVIENVVLKARGRITVHLASL